MKTVRLLLVIILFSVVFGCSSDSNTPVFIFSTVKVTLSTYGTLPAGKTIAGTSMTISLPAGVVPPLDSTGHPDMNLLVTASGVAQSGGLVSTAIYEPATATQPALLTIAVASREKGGFGVGEFAVLNLNLTALLFPNASDFPISGFVAVDTADNQLSGIQAAVSSVANY